MRTRRVHTGSACGDCRLGNQISTESKARSRTGVRELTPVEDDRLGEEYASLNFENLASMGIDDAARV